MNRIEVASAAALVAASLAALVSLPSLFESAAQGIVVKLLPAALVSFVAVLAAMLTWYVRGADWAGQHFMGASCFVSFAALALGPATPSPHALAFSSIGLVAVSSTKWLRLALVPISAVFLAMLSTPQQLLIHMNFFAAVLIFGSGLREWQEPSAA